MEMELEGQDLIEGARSGWREHGQGSGRSQEEVTVAESLMMLLVMLFGLMTG